MPKKKTSPSISNPPSATQPSPESNNTAQSSVTIPTVSSSLLVYIGIAFAFLLGLVFFVIAQLTTYP